MKITPIYDSSLGAAPAGYLDAIATAIDWFDGLITNDVNVTIAFGWGEVRGGAIDPQALGESTAQTVKVNYSDLRAALTAAAADADSRAAAASLPTADPTGGGGFLVTSAEARALGLPNPPGGVDGWVGLNAQIQYTFDPLSRATGGADAIGVLKHEISEVLGRISALGEAFGPAVYAPLDLFRYVNGQHVLTPSFGLFSLDGGLHTSLAFNSLGSDLGGDFGDWGSSALGDAFAAALVGRGRISATDLQVMEALGYHLAPQALGPTLMGSSVDGGGKIALTAPLTLQFNEPVALGSGTILLASDNSSIPVRVDGAAHEVTVQGSTVTIAPQFGLRSGVTYSIIVDYDAIVDLRGQPYAGTAAGDLSFSTLSSHDTVSQWFSTILRESSSSPAEVEAAAGVQIDLDTGLVASSAFLGVLAAAMASASVATLAYQFFTDRTPSAAGMDYLVSSAGPNPNSLDSAYYQGFSLENRYINFAVNLGKSGEGSASFAARYGSESLLDATRQAYVTIFGAAAPDAHLQDILDAPLQLSGQTLSRAEYFAYYGQDGVNGLGTKAAMVGWLLAEAEKAHIGTYVLSNEAYLANVALHGAPFGIDLIGVYGEPGFVYHYPG